MKAVILAGGNGTRMYPLTLTTPKPLTKILNKTILEYQLDALKGLVDEVVIVIGDSARDPLQQQIVDFAKGLDFGFKIDFAVQKEPRGTGDALMSARGFIFEDDRFILMNGDDIYAREDIESLLKNKYGVVGLEVEDPEKWGIFQSDEKGNLIKIIEKPKDFVGNVANIGVYLLNGKVFSILEGVGESERGEIEVVEAVSILASEECVKVVKSCGKWIPVGYPWHILTASEVLINEVEFDNQGEIEDGVVIKGRVKLGKGSVIKNGTRMEGDAVIGDDCVIGPNAYIRGVTSIGNGCKVGAFVEVKNSTIMDGSAIPHLSYFGDGVMGKNVNFACGCKVANLRHDGANIFTEVKGQLVDTGRRKFSTVIGDGCKLGVDTLIYPGRKLWPNSTTEPKEVIKKDLK